MKIYEQTEDIIIREMVESDLEQFLELMKEHGTNWNLTVEELRLVWRLRNKKGDLQCTITSADGGTIYGFCGLLHSNSDTGEDSIEFFDKYRNENYIKQADDFITRATLDRLYYILNT